MMVRNGIKVCLYGQTFMIDMIDKTRAMISLAATHYMVNINAVRSEAIAWKADERSPPLVAKNVCADDVAQALSHVGYVPNPTV